VAEALAADPEDAAIIEGYAALDPRVEGIAVYATGDRRHHQAPAGRQTHRYSGGDTMRTQGASLSSRAFRHRSMWQNTCGAAYPRHTAYRLQL